MKKNTKVIINAIISGVSSLVGVYALTLAIGQLNKRVLKLEFDKMDRDAAERREELKIYRNQVSKASTRRLIDMYNDSKVLDDEEKIDIVRDEMNSRIIQNDLLKNNKSDKE